MKGGILQKIVRPSGRLEKWLSGWLVLVLLPFLLPAQIQPGALEPADANEARLNRLQPPPRVMDIIGVRPGMVVAEIGAGRGRYVMPLADRVGAAGLVYAEDIDGQALKYLQQRCRRWNVGNVVAVLGDVTDPRLPAGQIDLIWIVSSYHHFSDPVSLMKRARAALKPDGRVAIGEWAATDQADTSGTTIEAITAQMKAAGFVRERIDDSFKANDFIIYIFKPVRLGP